MTKLARGHLSVEIAHHEIGKARVALYETQHVRIRAPFPINTGGRNLQSFLKDFSAIQERKILIHGGGKIATRLGERLGIQSSYVNGRRITDSATLDLDR